MLITAFKEVITSLRFARENENRVFWLLAGIYGLRCLLLHGHTVTRSHGRTDSQRHHDGLIMTLFMYARSRVFEHRRHAYQFFKER